jgi:hypothetical protein
VNGSADWESVVDAGQRRLTLTPLGLDIIAALGHDRSGIRLTPLATIIGAPVSSTKAALRILLRHQLVAVEPGEPPVYSLRDHPARDSLLDVAILTPEPAQAIAVIVRASRAVAVAVADDNGFVVGIDPAAGDADRERLLASLGRIRDGRPGAPPVQTSSLDDLARFSRVSVGSRARLASAILLKGSLAIGPSRRTTDVGIAAR